MFWIAHWFEFISSWWILKASRNCAQNLLRIPTDKFTREKNSHWFQELKKPVARQTRRWAEFHKRAPSPLFPQAESFPDPGCPVSATEDSWGQMINVRGSCFCGSLLAKVIGQMLSLWHQRSNLKWREIKKYIKNKRIIHLDWLLSIVIFVRSFFETLVIRIQYNEMKVGLSQW